MLSQIKGLHHVTLMGKDAARIDGFYTRTLGLRRVKQTVNFDEPSVYHLYYGDEVGSPGTVMTYFPFPNIAPGKPGTGEVGITAFSVPVGSISFWEGRLAAAGVEDVTRGVLFGADRLSFPGPDGETLALVASAEDTRAPFLGGDIDRDHAIRGFHSVTLRLAEAEPTAELLQFMGYEAGGRADGVQRFVRRGGNGADIVDIDVLPGVPRGRLGAGSVHHVAFAVADRAAQLAVREALLEAGQQVTPVIDRDYFDAIYFRTAGGVLFEVATDEPGFARDEDKAHLGEALQLPRQHEHLRASLEATLQPLA